MFLKKLCNFVPVKLPSAANINILKVAGLLLVTAFIINLIPAISIPAFADGGAIGPDGGDVSVGGITIAWGSGANGGEGIGEALCTIVNWFSAGSVGSAIASLAVIFLGIGAFFGKVTWGMAIMFAAGIFAIFGAENIVGALIENSLPPGAQYVSCLGS